MSAILGFDSEFEWLSNFFSTPITFDDSKHKLREIYPQFVFDSKEYPTAEHLYQSLKATNEEDRELIRTASTPGKAKKLGKEIMSRLDWDYVKVDAMRLTLYLKFYQHPNLLLELIETGNRLLVETNWWGDTFWGVSTKTNKGENWLGRLLMELRVHSKLFLRLEI